MYTCVQCDKAFNYLDSLNKHVQAHTDEINFVCAVCKLIVPLIGAGVV